MPYRISQRCRAVVLKKRQRVDNRAYGHTQSVILKNLYPADHPYSWPVIGSLEDLQTATLGDLISQEDLSRLSGGGNDED